MLRLAQEQPKASCAVTPQFGADRRDYDLGLRRPKQAKQCGWFEAAAQKMDIVCLAVAFSLPARDNFTKQICFGRKLTVGAYALKPQSWATVVGPRYRSCG